LSNGLLAQEVADTSKNDQVLIDYADEMFLIMDKGEAVELKGDVELRQDSIYMYADSATVANQKDVTAMGNVIIQQGDSLSIFADSLVYDGETKLAELFGEVVMQSKNQKLFTDYLEYDMNTKIASYSTGGLLTNDTTQLSSKRGYFFVDEEEVYFKDSVIIVHPDFDVKSDTLKYSTAQKKVFFEGPTLISQKETRIYAENGFYETENKFAEFFDNAQYEKIAENEKAQADTIRYDGVADLFVLSGNASVEGTDSKATADRIRYFEDTEDTYLEGNAFYEGKNQRIVGDTVFYNSQKDTYSTRGRSIIEDGSTILKADNVDFDDAKGLGIASGNVMYQDTVEKITIFCNDADYDKSTNYIKATGGEFGRPLMINEIEGDSLFLVADTLISQQLIKESINPDTLSQDTIVRDTANQLLAYNRVKLYKSDLQAVCDSLTYSAMDSTFQLFENPIIWSDTSQFKGDTVRMQMANGELDHIQMNKNSFIINSADELFFNQIKGRDVRAEFDSSEIRRVYINGSAESVYYAQDDAKAYLGVNQTVCSEMLIYFGNNAVDKIAYYAKPTGNFIPMQRANHSSLILDGFKWEVEKRPMSIEDLYKVE